MTLLLSGQDTRSMFQICVNMSFFPQSLLDTLYKSDMERASTNCLAKRRIFNSNVLSARSSQERRRVGNDNWEKQLDPNTPGKWLSTDMQYLSLIHRSSWLALKETPQDGESPNPPIDKWFFTWINSTSSAWPRPLSADSMYPHYIKKRQAAQLWGRQICHLKNYLLSWETCAREAMQWQWDSSIQGCAPAEVEVNLCVYPGGTLKKQTLAIHCCNPTHIFMNDQYKTNSVPCCPKMSQSISWHWRFHQPLWFLFSHLRYFELADFCLTHSVRNVGIKQVFAVPSSAGGSWWYVIGLVVSHFRKWWAKLGEMVEKRSAFCNKGLFPRSLVPRLTPNGWSLSMKSQLTC